MLSRANRVLPEGLQLTRCEALPEGAPSLGKAVSACRYRLRRAPELSVWPPSPAGLGELAGQVLEWRADGADLVVTLNAHQPSGATASVKGLLGALDVPETGRPLVRVLREAVLLAGRQAEVIA